MHEVESAIGISSEDESDEEEGLSHEDSEEESDSGVEEEDEDNTSESDDEFEDQGSSDDEEDSDAEHRSIVSDESDNDSTDLKGKAAVESAESGFRKYPSLVGKARSLQLLKDKAAGKTALQDQLHTDDLSSDDENANGLNTIGRVPLHWYDSFDHIGYDNSGAKVVKANDGKDLLDRAIENRDNPEAKRTVYDMYNARSVVLSKREIELARRMEAGAFAHPEFEAEPDYVDYYSSKKLDVPISGTDPRKANFVPSKWEMMKVYKIREAMKEGRYVSKYAKNEMKTDDPEQLFEIWKDMEEDELEEHKRAKFHLPAPKVISYYYYYYYYYPSCSPIFHLFFVSLFSTALSMSLHNPDAAPGSCGVVQPT